MLSEVKERAPDAELRVWSDAKFYSHTHEAVQALDKNVRVQKVVSGKLRRFYDVPLWKQLLRVRTLLVPNIIDSFNVIIGVFQATARMIVWRPNVVFCKGGFVSLPVGIAARILRIPVVLHDSDAHPGLANRLLAKWATKIGTGASVEHYDYNVRKTTQVGIPIKKEFRHYSEKERSSMKRELGVSTGKPLVVVTGGGLGAKPINDAVVAILDTVLGQANVLLISGDTQYTELKTKLTRYSNAEEFQLHAFLSSSMVTALGAADVVVARAGATTLLELAALAVPTILVPNPNLPGGHQTKNAEPYAKESAAIVLDEYELEDAPELLERAILSVIKDAKERSRMSAAIQKFAMPDAAKSMAAMILDTAHIKERS